MTFEVSSLSTFVFKKCSEKIHSRLNVGIRAWRVLLRIMLALRRRRWPSITSTSGQRIVLCGVSGAAKQRVTRITMQQSENTIQSPDDVSMSGQRRRLGQHWNSIGWMPRVCVKYAAEPVMDYCWASVVDDWPALNQEWAATLAQHWTGIWWVGLHPLYRYIVGKNWVNVGQHWRWWWKEYTSKIYLNLSTWFFPLKYPGHLGFWSMRAGPRSSGTPVLYSPSNWKWSTRIAWFSAISLSILNRFPWQFAEAIFY